MKASLSVPVQCKRSIRSPLRLISRLIVFVVVVIVAMLSLLSGFALAESDGKEAEPIANGKTQVDFNSQIRPLLSSRCLTCHGPDSEAREADLRLDVQESTDDWQGALETIKPGEATESELFRRISSDDDDELMPPADHGMRLSPEEISLFENWIQQGAKFDKHWSYVKPAKPKIPNVVNSQWVSNPIDKFVLARLEREGLKPEQEADRYALIRRLSIDLTGLPPRPDEVAKFINDDQSDAYARLVDRILQKETYGEHWATMWLDLARYADSAGYADDPRRTIWSYRDYVIRSFNENKPFDQFTIEQLAGDLLENPTEEQLIATAFHRNTLTNNEGGTSDEEFRNVAVVDRVNTTMSVWMGTTMACVQCHNHKYDPITQEEYYQFFALFNNTVDSDKRNEQPTLPIYTQKQLDDREQWRTEIASLESELKTSTPELKAARVQWEEKLTAEQANEVKGQFVRVQIVDRTEFLSLAEVQVFSGGKNVAVNGTASQSSTGFNGPAKLAIDGNTNGDFNQAKSTTHTNGEKNPWWQVDLGAPQSIEKIVVWNRTDGAVGIRLAGVEVSILDAEKNIQWKQSFQDAPKKDVELVITELPRAILSAIQVSAENRTAKQSETIDDYFLSVTPSLSKQRKRLAELKKKNENFKPLTTVPIMQELAQDKRRETHVQIRGNFQMLGDSVDAGFPAAFHTPSQGQRLDRLGLAKWILAKENPLTSRVIANRYWERLFGAGLVTTSEEFGSQGDLPSHPMLLDWLATDWVEQGWDLKQLLRNIVNSSTYRQSSLVTPDKLEKDPFNRLLTRGPRFRVEAEVIRDQALFVSGLLSKKMYGPPVFPVRPKLGLKAAFGGSTDWTDSVGEDRYRRAVYTHWQRSMPYPSMATFDATSREVTVLHRTPTNTPLQALVTLNDPVYVEAAQSLARKIMREASSAEVSDRSAYGLQTCLIRPAKPNEIKKIVSLYQKVHAHFKQDSQAATQMATEPIGELPEGLDVTEVAAWTVVANVLLNLDEMFQKR